MALGSYAGGNTSLPQGSGLGVEMDEAAMAKVADRGRRFRWPSPRNPNSSVHDY